MARWWAPGGARRLQPVVGRPASAARGARLSSRQHRARQPKRGVDKVLITGGAGFMGWHLGAHLAERGYAVDLVDNLTRGVNDADLRDLVSRPGVRLLELDLTRPDALAAADTDYTFIVHFAAVVGVARVVEQPFAVLRDNWTMLSNVLDF